jgi:FkbM family methyltransferase
MQIDSVLSLGRFFSTHPLSRDEPAKAWMRFLIWQIKSRLQQEVVFQWVGGQSLLVRRGMTGATGNIYVGLHEFVDMMLVVHLLREGDLCLDVGANIGSYSVLASGVCRARTWAFEPDPIAAENLKCNVRLNHLENLVRVHECALGTRQGEIAFTVGLDTVNRVAKNGDANIRIVRQETLDAIVQNEAPLMMKIDVEGYEDAVLSGASKVLRIPSLKVIEIEAVTPHTESLLMQNGFERAYYDPFTRALSATPNGEKSNNSLFVKDLPFVQKRVAEAPAFKILNRLI